MMLLRILYEMNLRSCFSGNLHNYALSAVGSWVRPDSSTHSRLLLGNFTPPFLVTEDTKDTFHPEFFESREIHFQDSQNKKGSTLAKWLDLDPTLPKQHISSEVRAYQYPQSLKGRKVHLNPNQHLDSVMKDVYFNNIDTTQNFTVLHDSHDQRDDFKHAGESFKIFAKQPSYLPGGPYRLLELKTDRGLTVSIDAEYLTVIPNSDLERQQNSLESLYKSVDSDLGV
jgi:hypothetical protein